MSLAERYHRSVLPTLRQYEYLRAIAQFIATNRYSPSSRELLRIMSITSLTAITDALDALETKGMLTRAARIARSITITQAGHDFLKMMEDR